MRNDSSSDDDSDDEGVSDLTSVKHEMQSVQDTEPGVAAPPPRTKKKNTLHEGTIQVFLRVRPPRPGPEASEHSCVTDITSHAITFEPQEKEGPKGCHGAHRSAHQVTSETYFFDGVLGQEATQKQVFDTSVGATVRGVIEGKPGLLFAFGITNAGKTYTIQGTEEEPGILPRALGQLLNAAKAADFSNPSKLTLSFMEIYNEKVYDLLAGQHQIDRNDKDWKPPAASARTDLHLSDDNRGKVVIKGLTTVDIDTVEQAAGLLAHGTLARQIAHTDTNHESSRSHSIVTMTLIRGEGPNAATTELMVVDLAGSERTRRTGNVGSQLKESARINSSLMNLGRCLEVLRTNQKLVGPKRKLRQVVPFRESKITRVLRHPLVGGGNVVMLCSIYPGQRDADETVHALRYASTAREVATTGGAADRFGANRVASRRRANVPRCAAGHRKRPVGHINSAKLNTGGRRRGRSRLSTMPTLTEESTVQESPAIPSDSTTAPSLPRSSSSGLFLAAEIATTGAYQQQQAEIAQLRLQIESHEQIRSAMEDEIREEMSQEMEAALEDMEASFQARLEREIAIHEEKFKFKLGILDTYATGAPCPSPGKQSRVSAAQSTALMTERIAELSAENARLEKQLAEVSTKAEEEIENAKTQHLVRNACFL